MKIDVKLIVFTCLPILLAVVAKSQAKIDRPIPHLEKRGITTQLIVDGNPFLVLGGELHNSATSNADYFAPLLPMAANMGMNTVLAAVSWELIEPIEGKFDFSLVDQLLMRARENRLKIVILWFGSWKNGMSHYVPSWVKKNDKRFPRVKMSNGKSTETLNVFNSENVSADAKAFAALMQHIKLADHNYRTVIMIQVENEVGIHGDTRDRSETANIAYSDHVPAELLNSLYKYKEQLNPVIKDFWEKQGSKMSGSWEDVFGKGQVTDEIFMAWYYAKYVNAIASAGKLQYPLPMYTNAWISPVYPRGGPVAIMHDIWRAGAPQVDILSPDIYQPNFRGIIPNFYHDWNPLFIPECSGDSAGASNAYYAIGKYSAIGYSPFGIETRVVDTINGPLPQAYRLLERLAPVILDAQSKGTITAVLLNKENPEQIINIGGYNIELRPRGSYQGPYNPSSAYGMIINSGIDEFIISGVNLEAIFIPSGPGPKLAGFISVWEGVFNNGKWIPGRKLNGDNIMLSYSMTQQTDKNQTGTVARLEGTGPGILKIKLYRFD